MSHAVALHLVITVPFAAGVVALLIPRRFGVATRVLAVVVSALAFLVMGVLMGVGVL